MTKTASNQGDLNPVSTQKTSNERKTTTASSIQPSSSIEHKASRSTLDTMVDKYLTLESFEEMYEATTKDFKPKEGETPDNMWRFHIGDSKATTKKYKDSDFMNVVWIFVIFSACSGAFMYLKKSDAEDKFEKQLSKETENINISETVGILKDAVTKSEAIVANYQDKATLSQYVKELKPLMSSKEKEMKRDSQDYDLLIIEKPKKLAGPKTA